MKIGSIENKLPVAPLAGDRKTAPARPADEPQSSTQVALSPEGTALAAAATDPSFDAAKVERIKGQIRDGNFKPNPEAIADKLIANAQELLARTYR